MSRDPNRDVQAAVFAARVQLAKETETQAIDKARAEWSAAVKWVASDSMKPGAFLWYCEEFDLDPSAVRRAIRERRK